MTTETTPRPEYDRERPMDNLCPNMLGALAGLCVELEKANRDFTNVNFVKLRSLIYSEDIQNWLIDLERLAYIPTRNQ